MTDPPEPDEPADVPAGTPAVAADATQVDAAQLDSAASSAASHVGSVVAQVKERGGFERIVAVVKAKWNNDPESVKEMRRFASDGIWEETGDTAAAKLKDVKARQMFFKKIGNRWFLENRTKAQTPPQPPS